MTPRQAKLQDIKNNPEAHKHNDLNGLQQCCFINGALDLGLMDAHADYAPVGTNGARHCDVRSGPCSCGAWH